MTRSSGALLGRLILIVPALALYYVAIVQAATDSAAGAISLIARVTTVIVVLGALVWWLARRTPWPADPSFRDYLRLFMWGGAYTLLGHLLLVGMLSLSTGRPYVALVAASIEKGWMFQNLYQGVILFAATFGIVDGVHARQRARSSAARADEMARLAAAARLAALQSQLTPHFFANALHAIGDLVHEDAAAAERAIERLAAMLRYTNDVIDRETVAVHEEIAFVRDTIALQELRFGDRLEAHVELPEGLRQARVPPFVIQPLVENALRHGLLPRAAPGTLHVVVSRDAEQLQITVTDSGVGMMPDDAAQGRGLGLRVLRERLAHHDAGTSLAITSAPGAGCTVRVGMPLRWHRPMDEDA